MQVLDVVLQAAALQSAANGIVITDRIGTIVWANPAFTTLTGYPLEDAFGQNLRILRSGRHGQSFYKNLWATILTGSVWQGEIINRRKDGSLYTEEMTVTPFRAEGNEVTHFIAIKRDVTERQRSQEALEASETRYRRLFETAKDGILILDPGTGQINDVNPFLIEMLGYNFSPLRTNPDMLSEFRVVTSNPTAEYGRHSGALVDMVSRSGTNRYHGLQKRSSRLDFQHHTLQFLLSPFADAALGLRPPHWSFLSASPPRSFRQKPLSSSPKEL